MEKERILFIVNPISGGKKSRFKQEQVEKHLDLNRFSYKIYETKEAGDGYKKVKNKIDKYDGFIAVGGDGTVNEVFTAIVNSTKWFSVIPNGSGNGLARTLKIPMDVPGAIKHLNKASVEKIDYALINGEPFINVAGVGFDAKIANKFKKSTERGFKTYAEITLNELKKMRSHKVKIAFDKEQITKRVLLVSFANSSQFGNNAHIAPNAKLNDGQLRVVTFKPFHWASLPYLAWLMFNRSIDKSKLHQEYVIKKATITSKKKIHLHIDGEARGKVKKIDLEVVSGGIQVMA
ncbi:MAG: diacylglycerol kinase [Flammeovirgaceae bacterium]|nr:diacylglycerol kinase [Flammeovirgaceae bacterium]MBR10843.1 diacylglycerol kinase [Rickettsiales bacterium]HCX20350.1 diacylglycerol kinase [Cytophagales bacterium]